jgi:hypothetical protein
MTTRLEELTAQIDDEYVRALLQGVGEDGEALHRVVITPALERLAERFLRQQELIKEIRREVNHG